MITIAFLSMLTTAGPNSNAELYINFGTDTLKIDSIVSCKASDTITAAIQINKSVNLYGFQAHIGFDTAHLQFITCNKENGTCKNHLETNSGSISFFKFDYVRNDSTKISIGAALTGSNAKVCPNGSGFLVFMKFRKKTSDTTTLTIHNPEVLDFDEVPDPIVKIQRGVILPGSLSVIKRSRIQDRFTLQKNGNILTVYTPETSPRLMQLFTINGKCIKQINVCTQKTSFSLPSASGMGTYVLRILNTDNEQTSFRISN
jgi:hypothetical protein